jgi:hypothetical protein
MQGSRRRSQAQWLMPVILATQETKIRKIEVGGQPGKFFQEPISTILP